jgi:hypothetical protein
MLCSLMLNWVTGEVDCTDTITIDHGGVAKRMEELLQKLAQPAGFGNTIRRCPILRLCTGPGHSGLMLG